MTTETTVGAVVNTIITLVEDDKREMFNKMAAARGHESVMMAIAFIAARHNDWLSEYGERLWFFVRNINKS